jgi:tRNA(fMet)-specific endonuclease VapC
MYLIDTDICIYLIRNRDAGLRAKVESHAPYDISISAITIAELEYGVAKSARVGKNRMALRNFLSAFEIIPFDDRDAEQFGLIRAFLQRNGTPIGPYDLQIASQGLARGWPVVTNDENEYRRVPGLKVENWVS